MTSGLMLSQNLDDHPHDVVYAWKLRMQGIGCLNIRYIMLILTARAPEPLHCCIDGSAQTQKITVSVLHARSHLLVRICSFNLCICV
jgi:hypothetical protein